MGSSTESLSGTTLTSKPSTASSASSTGSSRSRRLFGEIDGSCNQSPKSARSTCGLILCSNPSLLEFWNTDICREALLPLLSRSTISTLRLVCHGISERVTPQAFSSVNITFRAKTFSRSARLAALERIGHHVNGVTFRFPRSLDTMLPPLIDPWTGEQREFTWKPSSTERQDTRDANKHPRYGDAETTELLIRQYPPLFHAATNVHSLIRAMLCLTNLQHLQISCPGTDGQMFQPQGTDIVGIALTSLRLAIEQAKLKSLDTLTLSNVCHADVMALSPQAMGAHPGSARRWSNIRVLDITMRSSPSTSASNDQAKLLREYIRSFKGLRKLSFRWLGARGQSPLPEISLEQKHTHPVLRSASSSSSPPFQHLEYLTISNAIMSAPQIALLVQRHKSTLVEVDLENVILRDGNWQDAFGRLNGVDIKTDANGLRTAEEEDVPIMLAPSVPKPPPPAPTPRHRHQGQSSRATDAARNILLAEKVQQNMSTRSDRGKAQRTIEEVGSDGKRNKTRDKTWLQPRQLRRKCSDLFAWRMKSGPTLVVG